MQEKYIIGLPEWEVEPTADVQGVLAERLRFVKSLGLSDYSSIRWSIGGRVSDAEEMIVMHSVNQLWFEDQGQWQRACEVLDADDRFEWKPLRKPEANERMRIYKLVAPRTKFN